MNGTMSIKLPSGWGKVLAVALPIVLTALVAFATLKNDVQHLEAQVGTKADAAVVEQQYENIMHMLDQMSADIRELRQP